MLHKNKTSALGFIFITILIDCIGFGIIIPVMPDLIKSLTGKSLSVASEYGGYLLAVFALAQFICSPVVGALSDKFGRRPVLLVSLLGMGIDYVFLSFAPTIFWLFIGRLIAGITGASFTTAMAYIADISTPEKKAQNFGMVGVAFGIGFIIGPVIGGLCSHWGLRVPFMVAALLSLINWLYGYFILPESLPITKRRNFEWKNANPISSFMNLKQYPKIIGLIVMLLFLYIASHSVQSNWGFYTIEKFKWTAQMIGYSLGVVGIAIAVVQGGLIRIIIPKIGNINAIIYGLLLYVIGFIGFGVASQGWMMFVVIIPYCLGGIGGPAIQTIISNQVPDNAQGEIQGILTSLQSFAAIVGPWAVTHIFSYYTASNHNYFPGAPFVFSAILTAVGLLIGASSLKKHH